MGQALAEEEALCLLCDMIQDWSTEQEIQLARPSEINLEPACWRLIEAGHQIGCIHKPELTKRLQTGWHPVVELDHTNTPYVFVVGDEKLLVVHRPPA
jgi:hypothetical protein